MLPNPNILIKEGKQWVQSQRDLYRPKSRPLPDDMKKSFSKYFPVKILEETCFKTVPIIHNPPFYKKLGPLYASELIDFSQMDGITFIDTVLLRNIYPTKNRDVLAFCFHELVHAVQYKLLGLDRFVHQYVTGYYENEEDYLKIPLEADASALEEKFERFVCRGETFNVADDVRVRLRIV